MDWSVVFENYKYLMGAYEDNIRTRDKYIVLPAILFCLTCAVFMVLRKMIRCSVVIKATVIEVEKENHSFRHRYRIKYEYEGKSHEMWYTLKRGDCLKKDGTLKLRINPKEITETFPNVHPLPIVIMGVVGFTLWGYLIKTFISAILMSI